ncbi:MAG: LptF/LptG family permease [Puniceicoccales bacterium]|jgi:lipopolysaccharide export system permease protein|nr:LptF/LptG family permease [Puniceicoccales bacterium]
MLLLDRYIFREWLKVFVMTIAAMIGLLLIAKMFSDVQDFIRWKASTLLALEYFALQIPTYLPVVLPVALLISVLFILGFLHRNQELTAMRATGLSIFRLTRVLWISGAVLSLVLFVLNATVVPLAMERSKLLAETAEFDYEGKRAGGIDKVDKASVLAYANNTENRIWFINRFSGYTGRGIGVSVYQNDDSGLTQAAWFAKTGYYDAERGCWVLKDGWRVLYHPEAKEDGPQTRQERFSELVMSDLTERPRIMMALTKKPTHLSINEIKGVLDDVGVDKSVRMSSYAVQYHYVLASPFCCLIVVGLAIPFAVSGVRVNPMVGVSKSIVLFALYYLLTNVFSLLGAQQHLPPLLAAWLPNFIMLALAAWLCRRVN